MPSPKKLVSFFLLTTMTFSLRTMQNQTKENLRARIEKYAQDPSNPSEELSITVAIYSAGNKLTSKERIELTDMLVAAQSAARQAAQTIPSPAPQKTTPQSVKQKPTIPPIIAPQKPITTPPLITTIPILPTKVTPAVIQQPKAVQQIQQPPIPKAPIAPVPQFAPPSPIRPVNAYDDLQKAMQAAPASVDAIEKGILTLEKALSDAPPGWQPSPIFKKQIDDLLQKSKDIVTAQRQQDLSMAITRELKAGGTWSPVRYSHIKELITNLIDNAARTQFSQQLENDWQKAQAESTIEEVIKSIQNWNSDIVSDIQTSIETENSFDTNTHTRLLDLLNTTYQAASAAVPAKPTVPTDLCKRVKAITPRSDDTTINLLMHDLRTTQIAIPPAKPITVALQSSALGGGGASCGYHALKNGIYIARALLELNTWDSVTDFAIIKNLFGIPESTWRKSIIQNREYEVLQNYIYQQLRKNYIRPENEIQEQTPWVRTRDTYKIKDVYLSILQSYAKSSALFITNYNLESTADKKSIKDYINRKIDERQKDNAIKNDLASYAQNMNSALIPGNTDDEKAATVAAYLKNNDTIRKYLNLDAAPVTFSRTDIPQAMQTAVAAGSRGIESGGDWLNNLEIEKLVMFEKEPGHLLSTKELPIPVDVTVINNISRLDSAVFQTLKDVATAYAQAKDFIHIFCLQIPGHWFTLVLHKQGEHSEYFTANSTGSDVRHLAEPLIHILEALKDCLR